MNKHWDINRKLAADAAGGNIHGHTGWALDKARKIMDGHDPLIVLPADSKTWNFYRAIADPSDPDSVVIDRHVHDVIAGETYGNRDRNLSNKTRYATLARAVRLAARRLGVIPNVLQAVIWVVQTDRIAGTGTRKRERER